MADRWIIGSNTPGYLADDSFAFEGTEAEAATAVANDAAAVWGEAETEDEAGTLTGSGLDWYISDRSEHDLGIHFWAVPFEGTAARAQRARGDAEWDEMLDR